MIGAFRFAAAFLAATGFVFAGHRLVKFDVGRRWLLEVTLDDGRQGVAKDLQPDLPMVIHY